MHMWRALNSNNVPGNVQERRRRGRKNPHQFSSDHFLKIALLVWHHQRYVNKVQLYFCSAAEKCWSHFLASRSSAGCFCCWQHAHTTYAQISMHTVKSALLISSFIWRNKKLDQLLGLSILSTHFPFSWLDVFCFTALTLQHMGIKFPYVQHSNNYSRVMVASVNHDGAGDLCVWSGGNRKAESLGTQRLPHS